MLYDVARLEEKMLAAELRGRAELELVHLPSQPLRLGEPPGGGVDAALVRAISLYRAVSSAAVAESWGAAVVNPPVPLMAAGDKLLTQALLERRGIPTPRALVAYTPEAAVEAAGELGYPVVFKPTVGSWGRLAALAGDGEAVRSIAEHREALGGPYKVHYLQEYVRKPGRDLRVICVGGRAVAAAYRVSPGGWLTNAARGARSIPARLDGEAEELAVGACEAVGVEVAGVDLVEDPERGYLVLEVNGVPEFKSLTSATGVNVAASIAEHVVWRARV